MSLASGTPTFSSLDDVPTDPTTQWGNALVQSGGYDYIYGIDFNTTTGVWYGLKVARVPVGQTLDFSQWSYWNGSSWVSGESNAAVTGTPLVNGIIPLEERQRVHGGGSGRLRERLLRVPDLLVLADGSVEPDGQRLYDPRDCHVLQRDRLHGDLPSRSSPPTDSWRPTTSIRQAV